MPSAGSPVRRSVSRICGVDTEVCQRKIFCPRRRNYRLRRRGGKFQSGCIIAEDSANDAWADIAQLRVLMTLREMIYCLDVRDIGNCYCRYESP